MFLAACDRPNLFSSLKNDVEILIVHKTSWFLTWIRKCREFSGKHWAFAVCTQCIRGLFSFFRYTRTLQPFLNNEHFFLVRNFSVSNCRLVHMPSHLKSDRFQLVSSHLNPHKAFNTEANKKANRF